MKTKDYLNHFEMFLLYNISFTHNKCTVSYHMKIYCLYAVIIYMKLIEYTVYNIYRISRPIRRTFFPQKM